MLNAIIVDDELDGREALEELVIRYCTGVKVLAAVKSV